MALNVGKTLCKKNNHVEDYPCRSNQQGMQRTEQGMQFAMK